MGSAISSAFRSNKVEYAAGTGGNDEHGEEKKFVGIIGSRML